MAESPQAYMLGVRVQPSGAVVVTCENAEVKFSCLRHSIVAEDIRAAPG